MVIEEETIMYRNVVWHSYECHYSDFENIIVDFSQKVTDAALTINGPLFYALKNVPLDEMMDVDMFIPVEPSYIPKEAPLRLQTYYYIDHMLMTRVIDNHEQKTEEAYAKLFNYAIEHDLEVISPIFHEFKGDDEFHWVEIKVKVEPRDDEQYEIAEDEYLQFINHFIK